MPRRKSPAGKRKNNDSKLLAIIMMIIVLVIVALAIGFAGPDFVANIGPTPGKTSVVVP